MRKVAITEPAKTTAKMTTAMRTPSTPTPKSPTTTTNGFNSPSASFHAMSSSSYSYGRSNGAAPQRPSMGGRAVSRGSISGSAVIRRRSQGHQFGGASYKLSIVSETSSTLKRKSMAELGSAVSSGVCSTNFIQFIEWIRSERLATLPHKGSRWDKVLIRAQHFAEQLNGFDAAIRSFAIDSTTAAEMGYGHARLLLEVRSPSFPLSCPALLANPSNCSSATKTRRLWTRSSRSSTSVR